MKELCHICNAMLVLFGYTTLLFVVLCLSITDTTTPIVTLTLSILWCGGIIIDSLLLFWERERLDYEALD